MCANGGVRQRDRPRRGGVVIASQSGLPLLQHPRDPPRNVTQIPSHPTIRLTTSAPSHILPGGPNLSRKSFLISYPSGPTWS